MFSCLHDNGGFGAAPGHDAHLLYTVSGVQILATLNAFGELEARVKGGRLKIGQCAFVSMPSSLHLSAYNNQISQTYRIPRRALLPGMSGERGTRVFCTVH